MPRTEKPVRRALRTALAAVGLGLASAVLRLLPLGAAQAFGRTLGRLAWRVGGRDRRRTLDHLALAFPGRGTDELRALGRASFIHHATSLVELLWVARRDCAAVETLVDLEGFEHLERLRAEGRPVIILTGHCGNWELLAAALNCRGARMAVVARALDEAPLQQLLAGLRARFGTETIERGGPGAARALLGVLRGGGALGMLIDQDTDVENVWVPFFDRLAATPVGAARIALRRDAAVVPVFIERRDDGSHRGRVLEPLDRRRGTLPDDELEATAVLTRTIEDQVRRVPTQWVWMHRRWRHGPPEGAAVLAPRRDDEPTAGDG